MKKTIIVIFVIIISYIIYNNYKSLSKENDIDFLEKSLVKIKDISLDTNELYYFSNTKSVALYYKTQFALTPKIVIKKEFLDIPADSYILAVFYNKTKNKKLISNKKISIKDTIINVIDNTHYQVMLLRN